ncbi:MAG: polysaccharide deacetylase, partial [Proteobacteria bacterium]|nr:polysaccharide deacetylase [Pseudomonadota bacterium]
MVALPYTQEHNDLAMILIHGHKSTEYAERALASLAQLRSEADRQGAKVLCITLHPYIMGVPHRVRHLRAILDAVTNHREVKLWNASELLDWYRTAAKGKAA